MGGTLPAVAEELLKELRRVFQETAQVPDDLLLGLKFIFGPAAVPALDLVDHRSVTRVVSPSGRTAYQVLGTSGKLYTCYSSCHFCTCPAFGFTVLQKSESLLVDLTEPKKSPEPQSSGSWLSPRSMPRADPWKQLRAPLPDIPAAPAELPGTINILPGFLLLAREGSGP
ncbi:zinc finger SWIM domain-containing protein 7 isoform X1 [Aythya fuligula]|uniref:Zinc finger SWIM domain-containing protein 7 isoform X1 n=1 Tax=Aythya fuligula TaxID=219594 RepID=A0A6J3E3Y3_AYTFU|nr:zinc finger SWIM domain-containing protein 7 isoform X1 [Aythya fuligula]